MPGQGQGQADKREGGNVVNPWNEIATATGKGRVPGCRKGGGRHRLDYYRCRLLLLTADPSLSGDVDSWSLQGLGLGGA